MEPLEVWLVWEAEPSGDSNIRGVWHSLDAAKVYAHRRLALKGLTEFRGDHDRQDNQYKVYDRGQRVYFMNKWLTIFIDRMVVN